MQIERWSKDTGEVAIILTAHEYTDLQETLEAWKKEHCFGDGTCNLITENNINKICNTSWVEVMGI